MTNEQNLEPELKKIVVHDSDVSVYTRIGWRTELNEQRDDKTVS